MKRTSPAAFATHLSADQTQVAAERQEERPAAVHADSRPGPTGPQTRGPSAPPPRPGWRAGAGEEGGLGWGLRRSGALAAAAAVAAHPHGPRAPPPLAPTPSSLGDREEPGRGARVRGRYLGGSRARASIHGRGAAS